MSNLMTVEQLKEALPRNLVHNATQEYADKINSITADPEAAREIRENFMHYTKVLAEGKYRTDDYLNAVSYVTYKLMGYTNKDSYAKTFPDRYNTLVLKGTSEKDISAYVSMYHRNKLVNMILEQAMIPMWLVNQDSYQRAINTQLELMTDNNISPKVRTDAANSILTHLKPPEVKKVELDVSVKNGGGIGDLMATMNRLAHQQLEMIQGGQSARDVGRAPIYIQAEPVQEPVPAAVAPEPEPIIDAEFEEAIVTEIPELIPETKPRLSLFGD